MNTKAKLILSTIVLTSLCSCFLGTGTVDASEYNNKVVSLRAASDTTLTVSRIPHNTILYYERFRLANYNQSDSTQRWVMEYNANAGGYYIREQISGKSEFLHRNIFGIMEEAFWTSRVKRKGRNSVEVIFSRTEFVGKYNFYRKYVKRELYELDQRR